MNKVVDLDGILTKWNVAGYTALDERPRSSYHISARKIIKEVYPVCQLLEEVKIQVHKSDFLYIDFYLPQMDIMVEVQGEQHFSYSSFFHKSKMDFLMQKKRDREKAEWCELNLVKLIYLNYNETQDEWRNKFKV